MKKTLLFSALFLGALTTAALFLSHKSHQQSNTVSSAHEPTMNGHTPVYVYVGDIEGAKLYFDTASVVHPGGAPDEIRAGTMKIDMSAPSGPKENPFLHQLESVAINCKEGTFADYDDEYFDADWKLVHQSKSDDMDWSRVGSVTGVRTFNLACKDVKDAIVMKYQTPDGQTHEVPPAVEGKPDPISSEPASTPPTASVEPKKDMVSPDQWATVYENKNLKLELAPSSITALPADFPKTMRSFTIRVTFPKLFGLPPQARMSDAPAEYNGLIATYVLDCKDKKVSPVTGYYYKDKIQVGSQQYKQPIWKDNHGTLMEPVNDIVCGDVKIQE